MWKWIFVAFAGVFVAAVLAHEFVEIHLVRWWYRNPGLTVSVTFNTVELLIERQENYKSLHLPFFSQKSPKTSRSSNYFQN
jgi:hypothetical protein